VAGFTASAVSFAFGRFAYGALLPQMRDGLGLSFAAAGLLQSANLGAYLAGSLVCGLVIRRMPAARLVVGAVFGAAFALAAVGASPSAGWALASMAALGFCGGVIWIATATLVIERAAPDRRGWLLGVSCAGSGLGIPLVSVLVEALRREQVEDYWRLVWWAMAAAALAAGGLVFALTRTAATAPDVAASDVRARPVTGNPVAPDRLGADLRHPGVPTILVVYLLFGLGASVFLTFAMASISRNAAAGPAVVWAAFGVAGGIGALAVGKFSDRWGPGAVLMVALAACGFATAVPAVTTALPAMVPAAVLFGLPLIGVGVLVAALLSDVLPTPARTSRALAVATLLFSGGQTAGPVVAGIIIDATGSFAVPFAAATTVLLLGSVFTVRLLQS
jgi:predicted MFS family arabinose efflux permease